MASNPQSDYHEKVARTGETVTDETLFASPNEVPHVSAFKGPLERAVDSGSETEMSTESRRSSFVEPLKTHARHALKRSRRAIRRSTHFLLGKDDDGPEWEKAEDGMDGLAEEDANVIREALTTAKENGGDGKLYFRKITRDEPDHHEFWQVKLEHKRRACREQAETLQEAAKRMKSFLDYKEPGELDERFKRLYEYIHNDKHFEGATILFKSGKAKDWYPWKVRLYHPNGFTKHADTLEEAIGALEMHVQFEEVTPENYTGGVWEKIFAALKRHRKTRVFIKEVIVEDTNGDQEKLWHMKVDHPIRGIQFETKEPSIETAAVQVLSVLNHLGRKKQEKAANSWAATR
ncbi:uncharacterized protein FOMMEDRAFT_161313 [Fomitiporia mediterranea MF3/22]|uniref:uncharacterized protein n=1 Tax=Fomitiporia mediterranea (strain MF3/22) TaxID=694068 RepID=UPI00044091F2|nr:uncharacterized protein FOMMEDRAFT_161313 [Fomitiporia mediterranea MF3/22]EJC99081.1 hypothetical protein FOMMEDRAFT_161313 [Fomitiporia mediterranea MF3/22]